MSDEDRVTGCEILRRLARLLIRGPGADVVLGDLYETARRERAAGASASRVALRYTRNALGSALVLAHERLRRRLAGLAPSSASLIDAKLALRMLVKYPGLTAVAVFALALGIPASLTPTYALNVMNGDLPVEDGDRIVGLRYRRVNGIHGRRRGSSYEYAIWGDALGGIDELGAARRHRYNVAVEGSPVTPIRGAEMTASAFRILRIPPLLGRPLDDADEEPGALPVVVLGHDVWRSLFGADPGVIGRTVLVSAEPHTVVGVMPERFLFPYHESLWVPLRIGSAALEPASGPELQIFGRLGDGVTRGQVVAQLEGIHLGQVERFPGVLGELRPEIVSYASMVMGNPSQRTALLILAPFQLLAILLLAVACGNVGTLILARTVARSDELAVRTALGAGRARIVSQLFVESLVLALAATGVGLAIASYLTGRFGATLSEADEVAFWVDFGLDARIALQALGLSVFCALLAGVLPALKVIGPGFRSSLQRVTAERSGVRFGGVTSALIVAEVALSVGCLFGGQLAWLVVPRQGAPIEAPIEQALSGRVSLARPASLPANAIESTEERRRRYAHLQREVPRRLGAEPGIHGVALSIRLPGEPHFARRIEVDGGDPDPSGLGHRVLVADVVIGFFEGLGEGALEGRTFRDSDLDAAEADADAPIIINTTFAERVLRGRNPIGQRIRFVAGAGEEPGRWLEVVGVVRRLGLDNYDFLSDDAGVYRLVVPGDLDRPLAILIRADGDPVSWVPRVREVVASVDPTALVEQPRPLGEYVDGDTALLRWVLLGFAVVAGVAVVLSVAGLYALMAFTVAQRTREIGVRSALGAGSGRIASVIVTRALLQLAGGIALGVAASLALVVVEAPELFATVDGLGTAFVRASAAVLAVGLLACIAPSLRGLRIQPMEALRS